MVIFPISTSGGIPEAYDKFQNRSKAMHNSL
jgi:hypothetical protein